MHLKTIINHVEPCKSFVYGPDRLVEDATGRLTIEVTIQPRANGRPICSGCQRAGPGYDRLAPRRFEFVPLWAIPVFFIYAMRRVSCPRCGVTVEEVPWGDGKCTLTKSYRWFLAGWAKRLSWKETAEVFGTTWEKVFRAVKHAVLWGLVHREIKGLKAIGVDEIQWRRGHQYLTLVYQIDQGMKRLLWVAKDRTEQSLAGFFEILGKRSRFVLFTGWSTIGCWLLSSRTRSDALAIEVIGTESVNHFSPTQYKNASPRINIRFPSTTGGE